MTYQMYAQIETHMKGQMKDSAHDQMHVYRVLYLALDIAGHEQDVDMDVLIAACLLHDIGRERQSQNLELDHAEIGAEMARGFLEGIGWDAPKIGRVCQCIRDHRYRTGCPPESIEGKILFDADKLDVTGAIGMARTLIYSGQVMEPLYLFDEQGRLVTENGGAEISSFVQEFNYKLRKLYDRFFTARARAIAIKRKRAALSFYDSLIDEIQQSHDMGAERLETILRKL